MTKKRFINLFIAIEQNNLFLFIAIEQKLGRYTNGSIVSI